MFKGGERLHLIIRGRVQGVFYRASTQTYAESLNLVGWVSNRLDGAVELVAEGPVPALEDLERWCEKGPPMAHVTNIEARRDASSGEFSSFEVR